MTKQFEFESRTMPDAQNPDHFAELEGEIHIECRDRDGANAMFEIDWIGVKGGADLKVESLSPEDQVHLERLCQDLADEYACDAYQDYAEGAADAAYDAWKDRDL